MDGRRATGESGFAAGTAHSYYIGIETTGPAIPGIPRPLSALCVVSAGMEEGTETDVPSDEFGLIVGQASNVPVLQELDPRPGPARTTYPELAG